MKFAIMSTRAWSVAKTTEFVEALKLEEVIWNPRHESHRDRNAIYDAWTRLKAKLDISIKELKRKKDGILATYLKYVRKVDESRKSAKGTEDVFKPTWFLYEPIDSFLGSVYTPGNAFNTVDFQDEFEEEVNTPYKETFEFTYINQYLHEAESENQNGSMNNADSTRNRRKRQKLMNESQEILELNTVERLDKSKNVILNLYTDLLRAKLGELDKRAREKAMHEIDNLMYRLKNPIKD